MGSSLSYVLGGPQVAVSWYLHQKKTEILTMSHIFRSAYDQKLESNIYICIPNTLSFCIEYHPLIIFYYHLCPIMKFFIGNMLSNCDAREDKSPLDCKEIKPVNAKGNQPWIFTRRADAEAETPILRSSDARIWLVGKNPDAEKDRKVFINFPSIIHLSPY